MKKVAKKVVRGLKLLPQKKQYIELITALLSIPVLITVIILNLNSLNNIGKGKVTPTPSPAPVGNAFYSVPISTVKTVTTTTTPTSGPCRKGIGPLSITSPEEKDDLRDNPVNVMINYQDDVYCSVVWSYRINDGQWSDYDNKSYALYNLPQGNIKFELRVRSLVNSDQKTFTRNFVYSGAAVTPQPSPQVSPTVQGSVQGTSSAIADQ